MTAAGPGGRATELRGELKLLLPAQQELIRFRRERGLSVTEAIENLRTWRCYPDPAESWAA